MFWKGCAGILKNGSWYVYLKFIDCQQEMPQRNVAIVVRRETGKVTTLDTSHLHLLLTFINMYGIALAWYERTLFFKTTLEVEASVMREPSDVTSGLHGGMPCANTNLAI
jgi:hypothetical protein